MYILFAVQVLILCICGRDPNQIQNNDQIITGCVYVNNDITSVALICNNSDGNYTKDNCSSLLLQSGTTSFMVKRLKTGRCRSKTLDKILSEKFPNIITLDISHLRLITNYDDFTVVADGFNFVNLRTLNASHNRINIIGNMFENLEMIDELNLSFNEIVGIFVSSFETMILLKFLNLSHNSIISLDSSTFAEMGELQVIDLSNNLLEAFDFEVFWGNVALQAIHLANNRLKKLVFSSERMPRFDRLKFFSAAGNEIDNFNEIIISCLGSALETLDLSNNSLDHLNSSMFIGLRSLKHLDFGHTQMTEFDFKAFERPEILQFIDLSFNHLNQLYLSSTIIFNSMETLLLPENNLIYVENITNSTFPNLTIVEISQNCLTCDFATKFIEQWHNITVIGNPCDQKYIAIELDDDDDNEVKKPALFVTIASVLIVCTITAIWFIRSKKTPQSEQQIEQNVEHYPIHSFDQQSQQNSQYSSFSLDQQSQQNSQYSSFTHQDEPIYSEIGPAAVKYDKLNFIPLPSSTRSTEL